jgi:peroxiredoxin
MDSMPNNGFYSMIIAMKEVFSRQAVSFLNIVVHLFSPVHLSGSSLQEADNAAAKEIAKKERERLKLQEKMRKEQVEKMRSQLNTDAAHGEVRNFDYIPTSVACRS